MEEFNQAHKGKIKVKLEIIPSGAGHAYEDKINVAVSGSSLPDVLDMDGSFIANYAATQILAPMDEYVKEEDKKDFAKSIIQQGTYDGKLYALGAMESSLVLFYNKKLVKEVGITPPDSLDKAWPWQQFADNAKKLTKGGRYGVTLNMNLGVGAWMTYLGSVFI
ncbi:ABC transporter substrate-binding protein [Aneurinibacillus tyrosinisolvens]|uniref:ABC transporter substrate-binding protein n=1 Tax=Aneurinibacillus tyrosinisolvens TaxID=1443435 RepID=UPI00069C29EB|nr:extracellular solute-binding protein [Aneurinibacillus tyrosinisolvens]